MSLVWDWPKFGLSGNPRVKSGKYETIAHPQGVISNDLVLEISDISGSVERFQQDGAPPTLPEIPEISSISTFQSIWYQSTRMWNGSRICQTELHMTFFSGVT